MKMLRPLFSCVMRVCVVLIASVLCVNAQQLTGSVQGTVMDATGSVISGANVQLTGVDTGSSQTQKTGADGSYRFTSINPGAYKITIESAGFGTLIQDVQVELNKIIRVDAKLQVGQISTKVEVAAAADQVDTSSTNVSTNVGAKAITDLPLTTRDITQLVEMMPGTRQAEGTTAGGSQVVDISGNYAQGNGTRRSQSVFYIDGSENMGGWRNQAMQLPNPDTVAEVQVSTSGASAEFGKQPGVSMNAILKSGSNTLHGTAGINFHWANLNANDWDANLVGAPRPADKQKWVTGTLGGPIVKNRTFFFLSYQWFNDRNAGSQSNRMPTTAMLSGDFCSIPGFTVTALNGTNVGCKIPDTLINPISKQLAPQFPTAVRYSNNPVTGYYYWQYYAPVSNNEGLAKIDHKLTTNQQLSFTLMQTSGYQSKPNNVSGLTNNVPGWGGDPTTSADTRTLTSRHTWTKGSSLVVETRFAYAKMGSLRGRTQADTNLETLGGVWPGVTDSVEKTLPTIIFSGGPTARGGQISQLDQHNWRIVNTTSWMKGKHFFKFGGEYQYNYYSRFTNYDNLQLRFDGRFSSNRGGVGSPSGDNKFAYAWADFLLGEAYSFNTTGVQNAAYHGGATFLFAQDEYRFKNLTINAGLRYEFYGNQQSSNILAGYVAGHTSDQFPNAPVGLAFEGDQGIPNGMRNPSRTNFAPRLGLAWDPFGKGRIVLRAASGIYYAYAPLSIVEQLGSVLNAPTITGNFANISDLWGTARANYTSSTCQFANCTMPSFSTDPSGRVWVPMNIIGFAPNVGTPYQIQFNTALEAQLVRGLTMQVGYIGNRAKKGWSVMDYNLPLWSTGANSGNINARRPDQNWYQVDLIGTNLSEKYDSLQVVLNYQNKWVWNRFTYAWQHYLTPADGQSREVGVDNDPSNWISNPQNIPGEMASVVPKQQIRTHTTVRLPSFNHSSNKWIKLLTNGWQASSILSWNSGDRLNVVTGTDSNADGINGDRPDMINPIVYPHTTENGVITWFWPGSFTSPQAPSATNPYPFGTTPHYAIIGPGNFSMNGSIGKTANITERVRFQLRLDFRNLLNHANLSDPNMTLSNSNFGLITTKTGTGRTGAIQAKFTF